MTFRPLMALFLLFITSCHPPALPSAAQLVSISLMDSNGFSETVTAPERLKRYAQADFLQPQSHQKVIRVYARDERGGIPSTLTTYHPNGQVRQLLEVYNGRAHGEYREWHPNGATKLMAYVVGGIADIYPGAEKSWLFDGPTFAWNEQGALIAEVHYNKGVLEGFSRQYHSSGNLWKEQVFAKGKREGKGKVFFKNGQLLEEVGYEGGKRHGMGYRYWGEGRLSAQESFSRGTLIEGHYFTPQGEELCAVQEGEGYRASFGKRGLARLDQIQKGVPHGEVKQFNGKGELLRTYHTKEGKKHGEEREYFSHTPSQVKLSVPWHEGVIQGTAHSWYANGQKESQREFSQNRRHGLSTAWYENGALMLMEEYDQDLLIQGRYLSQREGCCVSEVREGQGLATLHDSQGAIQKQIRYEEGWPFEP